MTPTNLGRTVATRVLSTNKEMSSMMAGVVDSLTHVKFQPDDYAATYETTPDELVVRIRPASEHGKFVMQYIHDMEIKEDLSKKA